MPYSVTIQADSISELKGKITALAAEFSAPAAPAAEFSAPAAPAAAEAPGEPKKVAEKKTPAPKAETKSAGAAATAAEETSSQSETATSTSAEETTATTTTSPSEAPASTEDFADVVRPIVLKLVEVKGREVMEGVLAEFGIQRATQVAEGQRAELLASLEDALNK